MADQTNPAFYPRVGNIRPKPRSPLQQAEMRERPLDAAMGALKSVLDKGSELVDSSKATPYGVTRDLIRAIPFAGPNLAKQFEQSSVNVPIGYTLGSNVPELPFGSKTEPVGRTPQGVETFNMPTKELMDSIKWSDLAGTAGAGRAAQSLGYGEAPDPFDVIDAATVGAGALGAARMAPKAARAAGRKAKAGANLVGQAISDAMIHQTGPLASGPLSALAPRMAMTNVVKPKGGNWLAGSVEKSVEPLKSKVTTENFVNYTPEQVQQMVGSDRLKRNDAINQWIDRNLTNYIKKEMATPEDPVRKLAEEGVTHLPAGTPMPRNMSSVWTTREEAGFPAAMGTSREAQVWEALADKPVGFGTAGEMINVGKGEPWMEKVDPFTRVHAIAPMESGSVARDLGFDHIVDVLKEDLVTGRIRPEQLNKISMEQAVRRTHEYDQELAKKMAQAKAAAREGLPVHKEYPEGYKWIQLNRPGAFAQESEAMGHSVRGYEPPKGHPDWIAGSGQEGDLGYGHGGWEAIKSGKAKVYSLIDSKGEPHVTIEVGPAYRDRGFRGNERPVGDEYYALQQQYVNGQENGTIDPRLTFAEWWRSTKGIEEPETLPRISQIKGKGNAKPVESYIPYVQDFVRGGNWADVGDFHNTGLKHASSIPERETFEAAGIKVPKYVTDKEHEDMIYEYLKRTGTPYDADFMSKEYGFPPPKEGMAAGGAPRHPTEKEREDLRKLRESFVPAATEAERQKRIQQNLEKMGNKVSFSDNPDTMMMDVQDQYFGIGGEAVAGVKQAKEAAAAAKAAKAAKEAAGAMKASEALGKIEGRPLVITQADRTKVGGKWLGGPGFSSLQLEEGPHRAAEAVWGVKNPGTAKMILGGAEKAGPNAVYTTMLGSPTQHQSNQMVFNELHRMFKKSAKEGNLSPELHDLINQRLAAAVDKNGQNIFPPNIDILDPNFRKIADTFDRRAVAGHLMGGVGVGGKKGQIIDYDKIIAHTTDPALIDAPTGALGNRLFTLSGGVIERPDLHPAFPTILQGEDLGVAFTPVVREMLMKDFVEKTMREKGRMPGVMDYTRGYPPSQLITEDLLTELQKAGHKEGGAIHVKPKKKKRKDDGSVQAVGSDEVVTAPPPMMGMADGGGVDRFRTISEMVDEEPEKTAKERLSDFVQGGIDAMFPARKIGRIAIESANAGLRDVYKKNPAQLDIARDDIRQNARDATRHQENFVRKKLGVSPIPEPEYRVDTTTMIPIKRAGGGEITAEDLEIEERPL